MILRDAAGITPMNRKYSQQEVNLMAARMISKGFIRGTIIDRVNNVVWSRITPRGHSFLNQLVTKFEQSS